MGLFLLGDLIFSLAHILYTHLGSKYLNYSQHNTRDYYQDLGPSIQATATIYTSTKTTGLK